MNETLIIIVSVSAALSLLFTPHCNGPITIFILAIESLGYSCLSFISMDPMSLNCFYSRVKKMTTSCFESPHNFPHHFILQTLIVTHCYCFLLNFTKCCKKKIFMILGEVWNLTKNEKINTLFYKAYSSIQFAYTHTNY